MKQSLVIVLLIVIAIVCFTGYCIALIDWVQDVRAGVYRQNHGEALVETSALWLYTYLAIRFLRSRIDLL